MSLDIHLFNPHFQWEKKALEGINYFFKGNMFYKNELLTSEKFIHYVSSLNLSCEKSKLNEFETFLINLNGEYALIIETLHEVICVVDRVRSIPLFYSLNDKHLIISDDAYYIKNKIKPNLNEENAVEFLVTGYVTGNGTLFESINQIQAGEVLLYNKNTNSLQTSYYFSFIHKDFMNITEDEMLSRLDTCFVNVFKRLIESTVNKGKQIVVPLSGGLDSRIIVAMLKRLGVENVICFTYGNMKSREVKISKQVAEALGYEWHFVKYTHKKWYETYHSKDMGEYQKYGGNLATIPVIQDYLAMKVLKEEGKLPENSVIVPGHTGMIAGGCIPLHYIDSFRNFKNETFITDSLKKHYYLWDWDQNAELNQIFKKKVQKSLENFEITDNESCANAIEFFDFNERQAKYIINSVRTYEFFGYEWRVPLCDAELINFFMKVPINYRISKTLCKKYVYNKLFVRDLINLNHIECTANISNKKIYIFKSLEILFRSALDVRWGRYFKRPLFSRVIMKHRVCNLVFPPKYFLLNSIIYFHKEKGKSISLGGYQTLMYTLNMVSELGSL